MTICYAVAHGFKRGLFEEWNEARKQDTCNIIVHVLDSGYNIKLIHPGPNFKKYYAVARARTVGVFTDFKDVKKYVGLPYRRLSSTTLQKIR
uniref:Cauli_VI domain-containing protein n=1 Tax=Heterorhabditis bacteriophora TaxID=37862 RepID=A0A1I7X1R1_HETBA